MKDELNKLLESVKKSDENEYVYWEQLDISDTLFDKLFDNGFVDNNYVIKQLKYRNNVIDGELDTLDENDDLDSEIIAGFEKEQQYNSDIIDKIENDTHVMAFGDDYEYRYVKPFMLINHINTVINNDKLFDKYFIDNETVEKLVDIDLNQQYVTLRQARDMVFNEDRESAGDKGCEAVASIVNELAYGTGLSQDNVIVNLGDGYWKARPVTFNTVKDMIMEPKE